MTTLVATDAWRVAFPGAVVGALVMHDVRNPQHSPALEGAKQQLEDELRAALPAATEPVLQAYTDYYRRHGKTYHVKAQRESVTLRGKPIPSQAALVEAMYMAELRNLILTAGHDLDALAPPVRVDIAREGDRYTLLNGTEAALKQGDMAMADGAGVISSILRGPDRRTRITCDTDSVLFAAYAPAGIGEATVRRHLDDIRRNVELVAADARAEVLVTLTAS